MNRYKLFENNKEPTAILSLTYNLCWAEKWSVNDQSMKKMKPVTHLKLEMQFRYLDAFYLDSNESCANSQIYASSSGNFFINLKISFEKWIGDISNFVYCIRNLLTLLDC